MKTNRFTGLAISLAALLGLAGGARGQFLRGSSNPYGQSGGGVYSANSTSEYNRSGSSNLNGFPFVLGSSTFGAPRSNGYASNPGVNMLGPSHRSDYTTGGAGSFYKSTTVKPAPGSPSPERLDVPRNTFDRWVVERDRQAANGPEAQRKQAALQRSLAGPTAADLSSGAALNAIVEGLEPLTAKLKDLPPTAIDEAFLKRLNFTRGTGSVGLLRREGKIDWPALLLNLAPKDDDVGKVRQEIETRFQDAFNQVASGALADADNVKALLKSIDRLRDMASGHAQSMTFAENVETKRYLISLEDSVAFLKQPDAADWLPGKQKTSPKSLQELVLRLLEKKVRFAPAVVGNDPAYTTMHRALVTLYGQATPPQVGVNR